MFLASLSLSNRPSCTHSPLLLLLIIICHFCASNLHFKKCCIAALKLIINLSSVPSIDTFLTLILLPVRGRDERGGWGREDPLILSLFCGVLLLCVATSIPVHPLSALEVQLQLFCSLWKRVSHTFESRKFSSCKMQCRGATAPLVWPGILGSLKWICTDKLSPRLNSEVDYMPIWGTTIWVEFVQPTQSAVGAYSSIKLITVTCREWSEYWLFTVKGKQALGM